MKAAVWICAGIVVLIGGAIGYLFAKKPAMAAAAGVKVEITAERLQRGKYLFEVVSSCEDCHSSRDFGRFSGPVIPGSSGNGLVWPKELGLPGKVVSPNITPDAETGLGSWTDGEILRAVREGVDKNGRALFGFMPYGHFRSMSDEDAHSLVAYMRRLAPIKSRMAMTELDFPVSLFVKFAPEPLPGPVAAPNKTNQSEYGRYLATIAGCVICHTKTENGKPIEGMEFAGGEEFAIKPFFVRSANITQDEETGMGKWSEEKFVAKFRGFANLTFENAPRSKQANFTIMPWLAYSQIADEDLRAIFAYLKTVKAVQHSVEVHPPVAPPID